MVARTTELFYLNKLLKSLRYFHVVFLSVVLRVKLFNLTIRDTNSKYCTMAAKKFGRHFLDIQVKCK
jgi:hypothetical protein